MTDRRLSHSIRRSVEGRERVRTRLNLDVTVVDAKDFSGNPVSCVATEKRHGIGVVRGTADAIKRVRYTRNGSVSPPRLPTVTYRFTE
jgi:hypothetical protein